jgi:hypothetical protein
MAYYNELPVYKATYDLLLAIFQFTKNFSKEYKIQPQQCVNLKAVAVVCQQRFSAHYLVRMRTENHTQIRFKTYTNVNAK